MTNTLVLSQFNRSSWSFLHLVQGLQSFHETLWVHKVCGSDHDFSRFFLHHFARHFQLGERQSPKHEDKISRTGEGNSLVPRLGISFAPLASTLCLSSTRFRTPCTSCTASRLGSSGRRRHWHNTGILFKAQCVCYQLIKNIFQTRSISAGGILAFLLFIVAATLEFAVQKLVRKIDSIATASISITFQHT